MEEEQGHWQKAEFSRDLMQSIIRNAGVPMDGRILCRMRLVCQHWRNLIDILPEKYRESLINHRVVLNSAMLLEEHLLASHTGKAHVFHVLGEGDSMRLFMHAFYTKTGINPFMVFPKFDRIDTFFLNLKVLTIAPYVNSSIYLTESKSGDFWGLIPLAGVTSRHVDVLPQGLQLLSFLFNNQIRWQIIELKEDIPIDYRSNPYGGIPLRYFGSSKRWFCIYIPLKNQHDNHWENHDYTKSKTQKRLREEAHVDRATRPALNAKERKLFIECEREGITVRISRPSKRSRSRKNDSDDDDDDQ